MPTTITTKKTVSISRSEVDKKGAIVILSLKEYRKLCERAVPTYYLKGKEAENLDKLVEEGLREHRKCRCKTIKSLSDLD
ncbi:MAG: hypothetical protein HY754_06435 [Nitrospirae bacterium]|nr:hypothetical protein [Nitrospirota bacterium]